MVFKQFSARRLFSIRYIDVFCSGCFDTRVRALSQRVQVRFCSAWVPGGALLLPAVQRRRTRKQGAAPPTTTPHPPRQCDRGRNGPESV